MFLQIENSLEFQKSLHNPEGYGAVLDKRLIFNHQSKESSTVEHRLRYHPTTDHYQRTTRHTVTHVNLIHPPVDT